MAQHYSVRPEWVWSKKNKRLDKIATLRIVLNNHDVNGIHAAMIIWLKEIGVTQRSKDTYDMGGCWLEIGSSTEKGLEILLSSSGQDVLESLDYYVQRLYQSVIEPDETMIVTWEELPLRS